MQPDFDPRESSEVTDRRFEAVVTALGHDDPHFTRRFTTPRAARLPAAGLALVLGLLVTVLGGILPLAVGLHQQSDALLAVGGTGLILLPVLVPLAVRTTLRRVRPLWG